MASDVKPTIGQAYESIENLNLPKVLQNRIERHKQNISSLAAALLAGGRDIDEVRLTISKVLDSFKEELLRTVMALRENGDVG